VYASQLSQIKALKMVGYLLLLLLVAQHQRIAKNIKEPS